MKLKAKLKKIKSTNGLNLLFFDYKGVEIKVLMLEMNIDLKEGEFAFVKIKPSLLWLSNKKCDCENSFEVEVVDIKEGDIMANVVCKLEDVEFEVLMLKEFVNFQKKAFLCFKSNFAVVEK
jgi:hypothetical protein